MKAKSAHWFARRAMAPLIVCIAIALVLTGCSSGAPSPTSAPAPATSSSAPATAASTTTQSSSASAAPTVAVQPTAAAAAKPIGKPEKATIKIGIPALASSLLPAVMIQNVTGKDEGLTVQVVNFGSGAAVAQGLASGSVDVSMSSLNGMVNAITAGQPVKAVYAGFNQADFDWLAKPEIKKWTDLKGKTIAVSSFGSLTDFLTRYALRKNGLEPEKDVQMIQAGSGEKIYAALKSGKIDSGIIEPPFKWNAADDGYTLLGKQSEVVAPQWPKHVIYAKEQFIKENPNTVIALLRAHVKAIRLIKSDKAGTVKEMMNSLKWDQKSSERAYDDVISGFDEKGLLPASSMPVWWEIAINAGDAKEKMPDDKLLDRTFIDSFDQWAPK